MLVQKHTQIASMILVTRNYFVTLISHGCSLRWEVFQEANINIIVFITSPICTKSHLQDAELVSSTALKETFPFFELLCSNGNSSIHNAAITLFAAYMNELLQLKNQVPFYFLNTCSIVFVKIG